MPTAHPPSETSGDADDITANPVFAAEPVRVPRHELPAVGIDPAVAHQIVHDELMLDGNARLNLATFVSTWDGAERAAPDVRVVRKNVVDKDEYPRPADLELRCVRMLAGLWHAPDRSGGTSSYRAVLGLADDAARGLGAKTATRDSPDTA